MKLWNRIIYSSTALIATLVFGASAARADVPSFSNLSLGNVDDAFKTFGALMNFRPMEPASTFGKYFGVSVGVGGQVTSTKKLKSIPGTGDLPSYLPDAYITVAFQLPFAIGLEGGVFPARKLKDFHIEQYAANLKWTPTDIFFDHFPVDIAVRGGFASGKLMYQQTVSTIPVLIDYSQMLWNANVSVSKRLLFFEPYTALGFSQQDATLSAVGSGTFRLLGQGFPVSMGNEVNQTRVSPNLAVGFQLHLFFANLTAQYDYQFAQSNFAAKLAFKF